MQIRSPLDDVITSAVQPRFGKLRLSEAAAAAAAAAALRSERKCRRGDVSTGRPRMKNSPGNVRGVTECGLNGVKVTSARRVL